MALIDPQPDVVLDRLNQVVRVFGKDALITALYGVLDPHAHTWTYASAGHLPALLRTADGATSFLDAPPDPPLGTADTFRLREVSIQDGSTLVLYTDGLIERRGESLAEGFRRLEKQSSQAHRPNRKRSATASSTRSLPTRPSRTTSRSWRSP